MRVRTDYFRVDERRPAILATIVYRPQQHGYRLNQIGPVALLAVKIWKTFDEPRNIAARSLHFNGNADRVLVVFAQKHDRQFQIARRVERFPKLAFAGRAVAERNVDHFIVAKSLDAAFQLLDELDPVTGFSASDRLQKMHPVRR